MHRRPLILCSNDAKFFCDRIVHSVASIALQSMGMPKESLCSMFETIQQMEHLVRTSFGTLLCQSTANVIANLISAFFKVMVVVRFHGAPLLLLW